MDDQYEIILRGKGSDIRSDFYEPIVIPTEDYHAKINSFSTYNNIPNIVEGKVKLESGAYELSVIAIHMVE